MEKLVAILFLLLELNCFSQNSPCFPIINSNWIATDALGRRLPEYKQTGSAKNDKWFGLFYSIWHGGHAPTDTIYDIINNKEKFPAPYDLLKSVFFRPKEELYDLENDTYEMKNLAELPAYKSVLNIIGVKTNGLSLIRILVR